jgi:alpha-N-arabinofuranosidase
VRCSLNGRDFASAAVRYISGDLNSHNDFGMDAQVSIRSLQEMPVSDGEFVLEMPACCVMEIVLK